MPKQTTACLGFVIYSANMSLSLTDQKKAKINKLSRDILSCNKVTAKNVAKLIGNLVSVFLQ